MIERLSLNNEQLTNQLEEWTAYSKKEKKVEIKYIVIDPNDTFTISYIKKRLKYEKNEEKINNYVKELNRLEEILRKQNESDF